MIRFPPTSIALSESDIDFHLREIQIKEQLYAQGFTRQEVQRYYTERHGNANGYHVEGDDSSTRSPSTITGNTREAEYQETNSSAQKEQTCKTSGRSKRVDIPTFSSFIPDAISARSTSSSENVQSSRKPTSTFPDPPSSSPVSMPSSPPVAQISLPYRHAAVRQSSLLRIMHTAGSQPSTASKSSTSDNGPDSGDQDRDETESQAVDFLQSPATRMRSYRPRSKTYTYIESEADPPTPPRKSQDDTASSPPFTPFLDQLTASDFERLPQQQHNHSVGQSSPAQSEVTGPSPLTLPPPVSIGRRTTSLQFSLPDRTKPSSPSTANPSESHHPSSPLLPPYVTMSTDGVKTSIVNYRPPTPPLGWTIPKRSTTPPQESISNMASVTDQLPSTPPGADTSPNELASSVRPSPKTPIPPRTEPRPQPHRCHGTFGVYNDRLPAEIQPQTPADLQSERQRAITERNVAYTAPPGQIRTGGRMVGTDYDGDQSGMQSPAARSAMMRERRAMEFGRWRTVRMESLRGRGMGEEAEEADVDIGVGRHMTVDRGSSPAFDRPRDAGVEEQPDQRLSMQEGTRIITTSSGSPPRQVDWRDEFDEDRVGEENFEILDFSDRRGRGRGHTADEGDEMEEGFAAMARTPTP